MTESDSHRSERLLLLLTAGRPRSRRMRARLLDEAARRGIAVATLGPRDGLAAIEHTLAAIAPDAIAVCAEPDVQAVVAAAAAAADLPLCCVPAGLDDLLAFDLGVPFDDPADALALLSGRRERTIDLAEVNGVAFVNHVAVGARIAPRRASTSRGAHAAAAGCAYALALEADEGREPPSMIVCNNRHVFDGATLGPRRHLDGGGLGVVVWAAEGGGRQHGGRSQPHWREHTRSRLELALGGPVDADVDGVRRTLRTPLRFRCIRSALRVRVGEEPAASREPLAARRTAAASASRQPATA